MAEIVDGRALAGMIYEELRRELPLCPERPTLALLQVGEFPSSQIYLRRKQKVAEDLGIGVRLESLVAHAKIGEILALIDHLNAASDVHAILVQLPLSDRSMEMSVLNRVVPEKDVDGFSATNLGKLCQGDTSGFWPCTPAGIHYLLKAINVPIEGQHVVVLGRSLIVGKPIGLILLQNLPNANATVSFCHSKTRHLAEITRQADILIAAIGDPSFVKASMVKPGATVIDVGITRVPDLTQAMGYRLQGDVDFEEVERVASFITPVPGGVGPLTVAMLMRNVLKAYQQRVSPS